MRIGRAHRRFVKNQFAKATSGSGLVDDKERQGFQRKMTEAAQQAAGTQQKMNTRAAMAQGQGSPLMAGQMQEAAREVAEASNRAQVKAQGAADQFATALEEKRRGAALAAGERLKKQNRSDMQMALDSGLKAVEIAMGQGDD